MLTQFTCIYFKCVNRFFLNCNSLTFNYSVMFYIQNEGTLVSCEITHLLKYILIYLK